MRSRRLGMVMAVLLALVLSINVGSTAANSVPITKAKDDSRAITPDAMKPDDCLSIALTAKLSGSGTINGASTAELITGSAGVDTIQGNGGNDCILGGDGNDSLRGNGGTDICIGGPGTDTFNNDCETKIQ